MLKSHNIKLFTTFSERKASVVERLNRTLKARMWRYFTRNNTRKYTDILQDLVASYNKTYHTSIKHCPIDVNKDNEIQVWINLYDKRLTSDLTEKSGSRFSIGDTVRTSIERGPFRKSYLEGWSEEIFIVKHRVNGNPTVYKFSDQAGEDIKGTFYGHELQSVSEPDAYRIEKVLKKKKDRNGNNIYFVKWYGYSKAFNSYVSEEDFVNNKK